MGVAPETYPAGSGQDAGVSVERLHLCIEVGRAGDLITGTLTLPSGRVRTFTGRLGLFSAIDDEIENVAPQGAHEGTEDVDR